MGIFQLDYSPLKQEFVSRPSSSFLEVDISSDALRTGKLKLHSRTSAYIIISDSKEKCVSIPLIVHTHSYIALPLSTKEISSNFLLRVCHRAKNRINSLCRYTLRTSRPDEGLFTKYGMLLMRNGISRAISILILVEQYCVRT